MRVGEAIRLDRADINWPDGVLAIRESKFGKTRMVPVPDSTLDMLDRYARIRGRLCPQAATASFFVSTAGTRLIYACVGQVFRRLRDRAAVGPGARPPAAHPRPAPHLRGPHPAPLVPRRATTCRPGCRCCPPTSATSTRARPTGITPIPGLFRYLLLCARDGPVTWDDALWRLSPVGIIRCHSLSPQRRWMMSSRSCHNGTGRGLCVVALFAFSRAWRFISVSACA